MSSERSLKSAGDKTIGDFGDQWSRYGQNDGYYGSLTLFADILGPLAKTEDFAGLEVIDIGSGTGRIVQMLIAAGARRVHAVEPSQAMDVLRKNTAAIGDRVIYHRVTGDQVPSEIGADAVTSFGVLHHIPDPVPVMQSAHKALKPGGQMIAWLYGREGNERYLALVEPFRRLTRRLPHFLLSAVCHVLNVALTAYIWAAVLMPVPMRSYVRNVAGRLDWRKRYLVIYDQLRPYYAKYYTEQEARALFEGAGFVDIRLANRHGYSWTVIGRKQN